MNSKTFLFSTSLFLGLVNTLNVPQAHALLLVGNSGSNSIVIFNEHTNTFLGNFTTPGNGGLNEPDDLTFGPDGNLYVSSGTGANSSVLRYSPNGDFLGIAATGNGLSRPYGNAFGPDGNLYVSSFRSNEILRFNPTTGTFLGVFASDNNSGLGSVNGLNGPNGLLFTPDGSLYVATEGTASNANGDLVFSYDSQVLRYSPDQVAGIISTATPSVFVPQPTPLPESFGFVSLLGLALAPNNDILVSDFAAGIRRYNSAGVLLDTLSTNYTGMNPSNNFIGGLTFGTGDSSNNLYAAGFNFANGNVGSVLSWDGATGSSTSFTGSQFTNSSLIRAIGITATPSVPFEFSPTMGLSMLGGLYVGNKVRQTLRSQKSQ